MMKLLQIMNRKNERIAQLESALADAQHRLDAIDTIHRDRAALVSISRRGNEVVFTFVRNGTLHHCETYGTVDQDVQGWIKTLLARQ